MREYSVEHAVAAANGILSLPHREVAPQVSEMMARKELHATVCELNDLLATDYRGLATDALSRIGLSQAG